MPYSTICIHRKKLKKGKNAMERITSDIVIEILNAAPYSCNAENAQHGKEVRILMGEKLHWKYCGEVKKHINGTETNVALYERED